VLAIYSGIASSSSPLAVGVQPGRVLSTTATLMVSGMGRREKLRTVAENFTNVKTFESLEFDSQTAQSASIVLKSPRFR
jgi:hypothetical protein